MTKLKSFLPQEKQKEYDQHIADWRNSDEELTELEKTEEVKKYKEAYDRRKKAIDGRKRLEEEAIRIRKVQCSHLVGICFKEEVFDGYPRREVTSYYCCLAHTTSLREENHSYVETTEWWGDFIIDISHLPFDERERKFHELQDTYFDYIDQLGDEKKAASLLVEMYSLELESNKDRDQVEDVQKKIKRQSQS